MAKRVTSADVARASGVSRTTVSFVLNRAPSHTISEATRRRVLDAARELGYVRSEAGVALARGRTDVVILDLGRTPLSEYQFGRFSTAFSSELELEGVTPVIHGPDDSDGSTLLRLARVLQPFAVISFSDLSDWEDSLRAAGVQLIQGIDFAAIKDESAWMADAARLQLAHLRDRGHRRVAYAHTALPGLRQMSELKADTTREHAALLDVVLSSTVEIGDDRASTAGRLRDWRALDPEASALICFNDDVGLAVLAALSDNGIAVPAEIAVIGTDDAPSGQYSIPAMTTLRSDAAQGAVHLARQLISAMRGEEPASAPPHTFTLVVRDST